MNTIWLSAVSGDVAAAAGRRDGAARNSGVLAATLNLPWPLLWCSGRSWEQLSLCWRWNGSPLKCLEYKGYRERDFKIILKSVNYSFLFLLIHYYPSQNTGNEKMSINCMSRLEFFTWFNALIRYYNCSPHEFRIVNEYKIIVALLWSHFLTLETNV